jgi:hypothetical protein
MNAKKFFPGVGFDGFGLHGLGSAGLISGGDGRECPVPYHGVVYVARLTNLGVFEGGCGFGVKSMKAGRKSRLCWSCLENVSAGGPSCAGHTTAYVEL